MSPLYFFNVFKKEYLFRSFLILYTHYREGGNTKTDWFPLLCNTASVSNMAINLTHPKWPPAYFMDGANFLISYILVEAGAIPSEFGHFPEIDVWGRKTIRVIIPSSKVPFTIQQRKWNIQGKTSSLGVFSKTLLGFESIYDIQKIECCCYNFLFKFIQNLERDILFLFFRKNEGFAMHTSDSDGFNTWIAVWSPCPKLPLQQWMAARQEKLPRVYCTARNTLHFIQNHRGKYQKLFYHLNFHSKSPSDKISLNCKLWSF